MTLFSRIVLRIALSLAAVPAFLLLSTSAAPAMGRSEDPRDAQRPLGTEADPDIRDSDRHLQQLLFKPASSSSGSSLVPAEDRPSAASGQDGSRRE